jgi:hypothetical protein
MLLVFALVPLSPIAVPTLGHYTVTNQGGWMLSNQHQLSHEKDSDDLVYDVHELTLLF